MRLANFFLRLMMISSLALLLGLFAGGLGAQTAQSTKDKAKTPAKGKQKEEDALSAQIFARLQAMFKAEDINGSGELEKSEVLTWLGLAQGPEFLKAHDKDSSGSISKDEFEAWAREYADKLAVELIREEAEAEAAIRKYQEAMAKAAAQAKAQYQQAIERLRQQQDRRRIDQRLRDRLRRR